MLKKNCFAGFRVIFVKCPVGWYLRDVHPGMKNVSGSIKRQMTTVWSELIGMMEKKYEGKSLQGKIEEWISYSCCEKLSSSVQTKCCCENLRCRVEFKLPQSYS